MTNMQSTPAARVDLGPLRIAADVLIVMAWLLAVGGFFGGLGFGLSSSDEHWASAVLVGAAVAVSSVVGAVVLAVLGYWAAAWVRER